jgi:benzodiazapine receptor
MANIFGGIEAAGWGPILVAVAAACLLALVGGLATDIGPWYRNLVKPSWQPPNWLFGPAWTLIFGLTAWAGVLGWTGAADASQRTVVVVAFAVNGLLNMLWSVLFFSRRRPDWALIEVVALWLSILAMIAVLSPLTGRGCLLLLPYLLWVSFAAYLNLTIVRLNAPFGSQATRSARGPKHEAADSR